MCNVSGRGVVLSFGRMIIVSQLRVSGLSLGMLGRYQGQDCKGDLGGVPPFGLLCNYGQTIESFYLHNYGQSLLYCSNYSLEYTLVMFCVSEN